MVFLFEILVEFVLPLITEILADAALNKVNRIVSKHETVRVALTGSMYFGVGLIAGFFSLAIFPKALAHSSRLPGISLVITPVVGGIMLSFIAWMRVPTSDWRIRLETFAYGFLFAFAMTLVRLLFTT